MIQNKKFAKIRYRRLYEYLREETFAGTFVFMHFCPNFAKDYAAKFPIFRFAKVKSKHFVFITSRKFLSANVSFFKVAILIKILQSINQNTLLSNCNFKFAKAYVYLIATKIARSIITEAKFLTQRGISYFRGHQKNFL